MVRRLSSRFTEAVKSEVKRLMEAKDLWKMSLGEWKRHKNTLRAPNGRFDLDAVTQAIKEREIGVEQAVLSKLKSGQWVDYPVLAKLVPVEPGRLGGATRRLKNKGKIEVRDAKMGPGAPQRPSAYKKR